VGPRFRCSILLLVIGLAAVATGCSGPGETLTVVDADPARGFHYPYILCIPGKTDAATSGFLLVEPNNTGRTSDDLEVHLEAARSLVKTAIGGFVARELGLPLLVPVFPRPAAQDSIYTHLLDRDVMLIDEGPLRRLDLQLLAMVADARERLAAAGRPVAAELLLTGFSASGAFTNRFTLLHPERVRAVASGGVNGLLMLPVASLAGLELPYPLGLSDYEDIAGHAFDEAAWCRVRQLIYMGAEDENDAVHYDDGYSDAERAIVFAAIGERMQPDRWERCQEVYRASCATVTFRTYPGIGHGTNTRINNEIAEFFRAATAGR
jgi:hypothetical protein